MNKFTINNAVVEIIVNDITKVNFDAIVIPSSTRLLPSGNLRCDVLREAGAKVQMECNKIINKVGVVGAGAAVITSGGKLKSKHIIHTVGPQLGQPSGHFQYPRWLRGPSGWAGRSNHPEFRYRESRPLPALRR